MQMCECADVLMRSDVRMCTFAHLKSAHLTDFQIEK